MRYLTVFTAAVALLCLAGCGPVGKAPTLPFPTTAMSSERPTAAPHLPTPWTEVLVQDFSGKGKQPIPMFWGELYTVVIACSGGGPIQLWDAEIPQKPTYQGPCDGSLVRIPDTRPAKMPVTLWVVAGPASTWSTRVEER